MAGSRTGWGPVSLLGFRAVFAGPNRGLGKPQRQRREGMVSALSCLLMVRAVLYASTSVASSSVLPWAVLYRPVQAPHGRKAGEYCSRETWAFPGWQRARALLRRPSVVDQTCRRGWTASELSPRCWELMGEKWYRSKAQLEGVASSAVPGAWGLTVIPPQTHIYLSHVSSFLTCVKMVSVPWVFRYGDNLIWKYW